MSIWLQIRRAMMVGSMVLGAALYIVIMSGAFPPLWDVLVSTPGIKGGFLWDRVQQLRYLVTFLIPAILIVWPPVYWVVGGVLAERNRDKEVQRRQI